MWRWVVKTPRKILPIFSAIKCKNLNHSSITVNPIEKYGFNRWDHWTLIGPDKEGLQISNILKCACKQKNTSLLFFPFYCYGTQWSWGKSWDEEYRGEYPVGIEI